MVAPLEGLEVSLQGVRMYFACSIWLICTLSNAGLVEELLLGLGDDESGGVLCRRQADVEVAGVVGLVARDELLGLGHVLLQRVAAVVEVAEPASARTGRSQPG